MNALTAFIDRTTMYRLVLYYLAVLFAAALAFSFFGVLPLTPSWLLWSLVVVVASAWLSNELFAWVLGVDTNAESFLITALILVLIMPPVAFADDGGTFGLALVSLWAISSKYLLNFGKKHLFNPVAIAVVLSAYLLSVPATWWVGGTLVMLPFVLIGGLMVVQKLRRFDLVLAFFGAAVLASIASVGSFSSLESLFLRSPLLFLAFAMLTEPLTMPPTRWLRVAYGALVGILFIPSISFAGFFFTPELALVAGNLFSFLVSPKGRYTLTLTARRRLAEGIYEFVFRPDRPISFKPGQYLEWTIGQNRVAFDSRGNRRYFTIASAPESGEIALGVRFYEESSAFKEGLALLKAGDTISVGALAGDFTLPKDPSQKLAFIAGGIGVTPFASMARHLNASGESRDAVLLYSARTQVAVAYADEFSRAAARGLATRYVLTDEGGVLDAARIRALIPDFHERRFYISGPPAMVDAMKSALHALHVPRTHIRTDYFPGLA